MTDKLSDHASDKCRPRVEAFEKGNKDFCMDSKTKRGVAMCVGHALLSQGKAKNVGEALKLGHKKIREICGD